MAEEFLGDRKRALEEEFFRKKERAILERVRATQAKDEARKTLAEASGLADDAVLDRLLDLGIDPGTFLALGLVPVVEVAWADGHLDAREKQAVIVGLEASGIASGSPSRALVESWLETRPPAAMLEAWTAYMRSLCARLSAEQRGELRSAILGRARNVAEAAGGFLKLGSKVSWAEEEMLARLEQAFAG
jgi:hypothetical protein